jgi:hypothetical protein
MRSVTLELRKALPVFVGLPLPHAKHGIRAGLPETIDDLGMVFEMAI